MYLQRIGLKVKISSFMKIFFKLIKIFPLVEAVLYKRINPSFFFIFFFYLSFVPSTPYF